MNCYGRCSAAIDRDGQAEEERVMTTEKTEEKAQAIKLATEIAPYNLPMIIAMLTSPSKDEREAAKAVVRGMVSPAKTF
jgi:hypothetical protein